MLPANFSESDQAAFRAAGVTLGTRAAWVPKAFSPQAMQERLALSLAFHGTAARLPPRPPVAPSFPVQRGADAAAHAALGYALAGRRAVRADILDRVLSAKAARNPEDAQADTMFARWLGCSPRDVPGILESLTPTEESEPLP